mgnify:CR=1 FL=1
MLLSTKKIRRNFRSQTNYSARYRFIIRLSNNYNFYLINIFCKIVHKKKDDPARMQSRQYITPKNTQICYKMITQRYE